ncbi:MAG: type II/IV secretion system protein [Deltaproteobacteria bacterium]|nr:type II/IV secretion system protein [Deltaproteobacteria bacterium]
MQENGRQVGRTLLRARLIDAELLKKAEEEQRKTGRRVTEILVSLGVDSQVIRQALALRLKIPEANLNGYKPEPDLLALVPESWIQRHGIVPLERLENTLTLGTVNPFNIEINKDIRFKTGLNVRVAAVSEAELATMIESSVAAEASPMEFNLDEVLQDVGNPDIEVIAQGQQEEIEEEILEGPEPEAPIIRLVDRIIQDAVRARATDIHIEPGRGNVHVRYRIDGVLRDILDVPKYVQGPVLSRLKIMGSMDISEKRKPQDGRSKIKVGKTIVDLRISSLPTMFGEKIVLRLLEQKKGVMSLGDIGFSPHILHALNKFLDHPQGMILVTGPTGSGKTTTLYSALARLNDETTNIVTVEDPVEYQVPGINQVQINVRAGMTFASALRSILRQDPDIVLVGEMRDHETAEIACHAAQTGHLVLSTLHTNDAASTVTRLLAMGIDPFLIASSVLGVLSQRLVRQLCPHCKVPVAMSGHLAEWLPPGDDQKPYQLFAATGCNQCRNTGFCGRFPIAEILVPNDNIRDLVLNGRSDREITNVARQCGMKTIFEDGIDSILRGLTTFDEVTRVVAPPEPSSKHENRQKLSLLKVQP